MIYRIPLYILILLALITGGVHGLNRLRRQVFQQEFNYKYKTLEAHLRIVNTNIKIETKEMQRLAKQLGVYNEELNPYQ